MPPQFPDWRFLMPQIQNNSRVSLRYQVKQLDGKIIDDNQDAVQYTHGQGQIFPALEENLLGRTAGDKFEVPLSAEEAYGKYDDTAIQRLSITSFEGIEDLEPGMTLFTGQGEAQQSVTVLDIEAGEVLIDTNHPLAGKPLVFAVEVLQVD